MFWVGPGQVRPPDCLFFFLRVFSLVWFQVNVADLVSAGLPPHFLSGAFLGPG